MTEGFTTTELRPWRCHVWRTGIGTVTARQVTDGAITHYRVRLEPDGYAHWFDVRYVRAIAQNIVAFPHDRACRRAS